MAATTSSGIPSQQHADTPNVLEVTLPLHTDKVKEYAQRIWGDEFPLVDFIITKESRWNHTAQNASSTARGLHQFLDATWKDVGCVKTDDPYIQLDCGKKYIEQRYGTAAEAVEHWKLKGWY